MDHYSPLPLALVLSVLAGGLMAAFAATSGSGFWMALMIYSFGGSVTLIASLVMLSRPEKIEQAAPLSETMLSQRAAQG
jgi:hypothetical protein